jgi:hypothetical protein
MKIPINVVVDPGVNPVCCRNGCPIVDLAVLFRHAQQEGRVLRLMTLSQKSVVSLDTNCPNMSVGACP